jgi:hypothetical protein
LFHNRVGATLAVAPEMKIENERGRRNERPLSYSLWIFANCDFRKIKAQVLFFDVDRYLSGIFEKKYL